MDRDSHLFSLLGPRPNIPGGGAVLPQAVHRLAVHELDGSDQAGAGAAVVLVAARVAEVDVGADETLLVAQQDHNLDRERGRGVSVEEEGGHRAYKYTSRHIRGRTWSQDMLRW